MPLSADAKRLLAAFEAGQPPPPRMAARSLVGLETIFQEWQNDLNTYIAGGGSLLRIVVAPPGSGKTHLAEALKSTAAEKGFLICKIDTQAQKTDTDDLVMYRAFCQSIMVPNCYFGERDAAPGLLGVLRDLATRMSGSEIRNKVRPMKLAIPAIKDVIADLVDAIRLDIPLDKGWRALLAVMEGEKIFGISSVTALRRYYPSQFRSLKKLPGKRDARLWLESLLLILQPLGFPGVLLVLDEHDDARKQTLDLSIVNLRHQLDKLAEGHLPGTFVLYLVLDDFPDRVSVSHPALDQRTSPIIEGKFPSRLMTDLESLRDIEGVDFLLEIAKRIHLLVFEAPMPSNLVPLVTELANKHSLKLGGINTRAFVKSFSQFLDA